MGREQVDAVLRSLDGWNRGDLDAWLGPAHPEIEWISEVVQRLEGSDRVYRGHAELRRYWDDWHAVWDVAIEVTETFDLGNTVLVLARVRMRGGASGLGLTRPIAYVFEFDDEGLARRARAYFDPQEALDAVGLPEQRLP